MESAFFEELRKKMPEVRQAITHEFRIDESRGWIMVSLDPGEVPHEIWLMLSKAPDGINNILDSFSKAVSLALQQGIPLQVLVDKFRSDRCEPMGFTDHPNIRFATSPISYLFRWLEHRFLQTNREQPKLPF